MKNVLKKKYFKRSYESWILKSKESPCSNLRIVSLTKEFVVPLKHIFNIHEYVKENLEKQVQYWDEENELTPIAFNLNSLKLSDDLSHSIKIGSEQMHVRTTINAVVFKVSIGEIIQAEVRRVFNNASRVLINDSFHGMVQTRSKENPKLLNVNLTGGDLILFKVLEINKGNEQEHPSFKGTFRCHLKDIDDLELNDVSSPENLTTLSNLPNQQNSTIVNSDDTTNMSGSEDDFKTKMDSESTLTPSKKKKKTKHSPKKKSKKPDKDKEDSEEEENNIVHNRKIKYVDVYKKENSPPEEIQTITEDEDQIPSAQPPKENVRKSILKSSTNDGPKLKENKEKAELKDSEDSHSENHLDEIITEVINRERLRISAESESNEDQDLSQNLAKTPKKPNTPNRIVFSCENIKTPLKINSESSTELSSPLHQYFKHKKPKTKKHEDTDKKQSTPTVEDWIKTGNDEKHKVTAKTNKNSNNIQISDTLSAEKHISNDSVVKATPTKRKLNETAISQVNDTLENSQDGEPVVKKKKKHKKHKSEIGEQPNITLPVAERENTAETPAKKKKKKHKKDKSQIAENSVLSQESVSSAHISSVDSESSTELTKKKKKKHKKDKSQNDESIVNISQESISIRPSNAIVLNNSTIIESPKKKKKKHKKEKSLVFENSVTEGQENVSQDSTALYNGEKSHKKKKKKLHSESMIDTSLIDDTSFNGVPKKKKKKKSKVHKE